MKKGNPFQTDAEVKTRVSHLKKYFSASDNTYIQFDNYYINLVKRNGGEGVRWFHQNKYQIKVVVDSPEGGPSRDISEFVLFSNLDDALLHAVLTEEAYLRSLIKS